MPSAAERRRRLDRAHINSLRNRGASKCSRLRFSGRFKVGEFVVVNEADPSQLQDPKTMAACEPSGTTLPRVADEGRDRDTRAHELLINSCCGKDSAQPANPIFRSTIGNIPGLKLALTTSRVCRVLVTKVVGRCPRRGRKAPPQSTRYDLGTPSMSASSDSLEDRR